MRLSSLTALAVGFLALVLAFFGSPGEARAHPESEVMTCVMTALDHKPFAGTKTQRLSQARRLQPGTDLWIGGGWKDLPQGSNPYRLCVDSAAAQTAAASQESADLLTLVYDPSGRRWEDRATDAEARLKKANADAYYFAGEGKNRKAYAYKDRVSVLEKKLSGAGWWDLAQWALIAILLAAVTAAGVLLWLRVRKDDEYTPEKEVLDILSKDDETSNELLDLIRRNRTPAEALRQWKWNQANAADAPRAAPVAEEPILSGEERRYEDEPRP